MLSLPSRPLQTPPRGRSPSPKLRAHPRYHEEVTRQDAVTLQKLKRSKIISGIDYQPELHKTHVILAKLDQVDEHGQTMYAIFKPRYLGDNYGFGRSPMECVAYRLNHLLGMNRVPPTIYIHSPVRFRVNDEDRTFYEGSLQYFLGEGKNLREISDGFLQLEQKDYELFRSDTRILDTILQNPDRNIDNFLKAKGWSKRAKASEIYLIDHAASLRPTTETHFLHDDAFHAGAIQTFRARTVEALERITKEDLAINVDEGLIDKKEATEIYDRIHAKLGGRNGKDGLLQFIDHRVREHGVEKVIIKA